jgi:hypothetical protein
VSPLFNINFRRESYLREVARARRRVVALGTWVAYFGVLAVVLGLYGLNCAVLARRAARIERQTATMHSQVGSRDDWKVEPGELSVVERYVANPIRWRNRLGRLAALMPANAKLMTLAVNPDNLTGPAEENRLVISGQLKLAPGQDRMRGVVDIVSALRADSLFSAGYRTIRLATTRINEGAGSVAEFVIECQQ